MNYALLILAFFVTLLATPLIRRIAIKLRIYDTPGKNKIHKKPVPYFGGLAVYSGFLVSILFIIFTYNLNVLIKRQLFVILFGAAVLLFSGLLDDLKKIKAVYKLLFEFVIMLLLFYMGIKISFFNNGLINLLFVSLWALFIINSFNNIDGLDGLAAGTAVICSFFFALVYSIMGSAIAVMLSLSLIGCCLAFLIYNFNPAKIFMGDAGSLFIGFILAVIPLFGFIGASNPFKAAVIPVIILGFMIFDSSFTLLRRLINGKNIITGDLNHSYNWIYNKVKSTKKTVIFFYLVNIFIGGIAFLLFMANLQK